ncbi:UNVERIFIED_CONTAM: hypothetical protein Scaly_1495600 [Sesamum calycinum]|uniref:Reverse transcriptase domain-containing protein n=1 Tax=Sesamum calycinum TaxID=2727403 RepID=A0AAW2PP84_9LAMI
MPCLIGAKAFFRACFGACRVVTPEEVKQAIFHISDNKAPGPDGYSACFFKRAWHIVGDQVCTAVLDFFRSGRLLRQLNHSIIALVPKSDHCPTVADYRPISCCNVIYKAITKIIADRLAPALEHLTDRCQAAFVGGRSITDNIFLAQEMVRQYTRKRISPRCTINVDLRKAFDSVSWTFLSQVLHGGTQRLLHGFFAGKKGLRQGDPMSPGLFLLCMEYFSRLIKRKTTDSDFNFHPKCEKLKITHLLFADDLMMFSRGDLPSVHILMECLQEFRDVSGLAVNTSNPAFLRQELRTTCSATFLQGLSLLGVRCQSVSWHSPAAQRLSVRDYSPLVDQIANSISRWAAKSLSFAGRLELIRSVIQGVECFLATNSHSQRQSLRKSTGFVGIFSGTPNEHRLLGRISVIPKMKGSWHPAYKLGTWPSLPEFYGTSTARQTRFGYSGSTLSISKEDQFGIGNRRRATHHSFNGLPKFNFITAFGSRGGNPAHGRMEQQLSTRDRLMFLQEDSSCSLCINTQETAKHLFFECPFSIGPTSGSGLAFIDACPHSSVR